jgi:hypothetical protein
MPQALVQSQSATGPIAPLAELLEYRHPALLQRLSAKASVRSSEAEELFDDTKRFLYLCAISSDTLAPSSRIDECWHHFILFTEDYATFCNRFLGKFMHHRPRYPDDPPGDGRPVRNALIMAKEVFGDRLSQNWDYGTQTYNCTPSTNCQSTPTGCGSSPTGQ